MFESVFGVAFLSSVALLAAAPAWARTLKKQGSAWSVCQILQVGCLRERPNNIQKLRENNAKRSLRTHSKQLTERSSQNGPRSLLRASGCEKNFGRARACEQFDVTILYIICGKRYATHGIYWTRTESTASAAERFALLRSSRVSHVILLVLALVWGAQDVAVAAGMCAPSTSHPTD